MPFPTAFRGEPQSRSLVAWVLQASLATIFFATGIGTIAEIPAAADSVDQVGLGDYFRLLVGVVEVIGAAIILLPNVAVLGRCGLRSQWVLRSRLTSTSLLTAPSAPRCCLSHPCWWRCSGANSSPGSGSGCFKRSAAAASRRTAC